MPHAAMQPYHLLVDMLGRAIDIRTADTPAEISERLRAWVEQAGVRDHEVGDGLAVLMGVAGDAGSFGSMTPRERRKQISAALIDLGRGLAAHAPVVLAFEDLHWADQQSLEMIADMRAALAEVPILFLLTSRPLVGEDAVTQEAGGRLLSAVDVTVDLAELDEGMSADLVLALAPGVEAWPELVRTIARKSQGNPFFVQSIVGSLVDQGIIVAGPDGSMQLRGVVDEISVPDSVWSVLAERIDRLAPDEKRTVQMAAIVGTVFLQSLVGDLAVAPAIEQELEHLRTRDFVEPHGAAEFADDWEWVFRHALTQEVAYAGMLRAVRRAGHRRVASWLQQHAGERRGEQAALLAYHYERGEDWENTAHFAEEAGDRATEIFANREAAAAYHQALHALAQQETTAERQLRTVEVTLKLVLVSSVSPAAEVLPLLDAAGLIARELEDAGLQLRVATAKQMWLWTSYSRRGFR